MVKQSVLWLHSQSVNQVLSLQCVHSTLGGVAGDADITQGLPRIQELFEARVPKAKSIISEINGHVSSITTQGDHNNQRSEVTVANDLETKTYLTPMVRS